MTDLPLNPAWPNSVNTSITCTCTVTNSGWRKMETITLAMQSESPNFILSEVQAAYFTFLETLSRGSVGVQIVQILVAKKYVMSSLYKNCYWVESKSGYEKQRASPYKKEEKDGLMISCNLPPNQVWMVLTMVQNGPVPPKRDLLQHNTYSYPRWIISIFGRHLSGLSPFWCWQHCAGCYANSLLSELNWATPMRHASQTVLSLRS